MTLVPWTTLALAMTLAGSPPGDDRSSPPSSPEWRFVLPAPGDPFEHAPFRALVLGREKPEDLTEKPIYRGDPSRRRYAQIRFGSAGSIRVTVVLDEVAPGEVDLYVDADRNRRIDDRDRVAQAASIADGRRERVWRLPLDVAMVDKDETRTIPRAVVFRLGASGRTLGYASAGYLEGVVAVGDTSGAKARRLAARRVRRRRQRPDGRRPGPPLDRPERRRPLRPVRRAVPLRHHPQPGPGALRRAFRPIGEPAGHRAADRRRHVAAGLEGRSRRSRSCRGDRRDARHRAGPRRLGLRALRHRAGDRPGRRVPAGDGHHRPRRSQGRPALVVHLLGQRRRGAPRWYKVEKDGAVSIDPIGTPIFEIGLGDHAAQPAKPGSDVSVQPLLYNADGLLINVGYRGAPASPALQEVLGAQVSLRTTEDHTLATAHSGFA